MLLQTKSAFTALLLSVAVTEVSAFQAHCTPRSRFGLHIGREQWRPLALNLAAKDAEFTLEELKAELTAYMEKRKEVDADRAAKEQVGRVVGGTKGNPILEYVSGSPNREYIIDEAPNIFDYDELVRIVG